MTNATNLSNLYKMSLDNLENVDGLMLDRQDGQRVLVQVESLVVGQEYLVSFKSSSVAEAAGLNVDYVEGIVLEGVARVRRHRLVVPEDETLTYNSIRILYNSLHSMFDPDL